MQRLTYKEFTGSSSWTAPAGVTVVFVQACGGGGGGDTAASPKRSFGGNPAMLSCVPLTVVPNTTYTITIGNGGGANADGDATTFGSLATFRGGSDSRTDNIQSISGAGFIQAYRYTTSNGASASNNAVRQIAAARGSAGTDSGANYGGHAGGACRGTGGSGSNGTAGVAGSGGTASANTGSGGGGGGIGSSGGTGGSGGSGHLIVFWLE